MTIALNHLRRNRRDIQSQPLANRLFVFRFQMRRIAHRAGQLANPHLLCRHLEALDVALHFRVPVRQLQPEGDRLGMNAVCAPDRRRVLELPGAALQYLAQLPEIVTHDCRRLLHQQRLGSIDHIVRRQAVMQPARFRADLFRNRRGEGNDVMLHLGLDLVNTRDLEAALFAHGLGRRLRHNAGLGQRFGSSDSTSSQVWNLFSSLQMRPISGRV